jgi:hypothetical protein
LKGPLFDRENNRFRIVMSAIKVSAAVSAMIQERKVKACLDFNQASYSRGRRQGREVSPRLCEGPRALW